MNLTEHFWLLDARDRKLAAAPHAPANPILRGREAAHVDVAGRPVDFAALLAQPWPRGERAMVELACTLRGGEEIAEARVSPLLHTPDEQHLTRAREAILIPRDPPPHGPTTSRAG